MEFEKAELVIKNFETEVTAFLKENTLSELKTFNNLKDKENIGEVYRHDQWYFENISSFKTKYFSLKAYFIKEQVNNSERTLSRRIDSMLSYLEEQIKMLDLILNTAKQRIKFYENVIYLVSNFNYGNY